MAGLLFITRKFPPAVGGMETLAFDVWASLASAGTRSAQLVAHGGSQRWLPVFWLQASRAVVREVRAGRVDTVLAGDVVMFMLLTPVVRALRVPIATMAMGKDVVWGLPGYRMLVRRLLPGATRVIAISAATAQEVRRVGVRPDRVAVVRLGIRVPAIDKTAAAAARAELRRRLGLGRQTPVVAMLGRLVRRKGVAWFLRDVAPALPPDVVFVVAGSGEDAPAVQDARAAFPDPGRVILMGRVDDETRELVMAGGDLFVQPNIPVPGDMEGFGLVAVEAAMRGSLVVAADLEGLRDAVMPGVTGELVPPRDRDAWVQRIDALLADRDQMRSLAMRYRDACRTEYSRERMGRVLQELLAEQ